MPVNSCLFLMRVKIGSALQYANVLWDCASICLITGSKAKELGLHGIPSEISLTVVGGVQRSMQSKPYKVPHVDLKGHKFIIEVHSINIISNDTRVEFFRNKKILP